MIENLYPVYVPHFAISTGGNILGGGQMAFGTILNGSANGFTFVIDANGTFAAMTDGPGGTHGPWTASVWFDDPNPIPIPASALLLGSGLLGITGLRRKFRKS